MSKRSKILLIVSLLAAGFVICAYKGFEILEVWTRVLCLVACLVWASVFVKGIREGHQRDRQLTRRLKRLCPTCSYDLRAHPPGSVCPECGTPAPAPHATISQPKEPS